MAKTSHLFFVYIFPDLEIRRHHVHPTTTTIHFNTAVKDTLARGVWIKNCLSFHRGVAALTAHLDYTKFVQVLYLGLYLARTS